MKKTFDKLVSQLDLVAKTMRIMDQRIQCLEGQISTLYNRQRKGFIQKQPNSMDTFKNIMLENSSNFIPNNSINESQKINHNNFDYYRTNISKENNFKETFNLGNDDNKNLFKTEINRNERDEQNKYEGQLHEEFEYNGDNQGNEEMENKEEYEQNMEEQFSNNEEGLNGEEFEEGQGDENENEQFEECNMEEGEEYEEGQQEQEEYDMKDDKNDGNENGENK